MSIQIQFYADQRQLQSIILIDILYRYKNIKKINIDVLQRL